MKTDQESYFSAQTSDFCNFNLYHAGRLHKMSADSFVFGGYNCWHIVSRNSGYVISKGKRYPLEKGDLFSVVEDTRIEYGADSEEGWEFYYLRLEGPMARAITEKTGFTSDHPVVKTSKKEEVLSLFQEILLSLKNGEKNGEYFAGKILLLSHILTEEYMPEYRRSNGDYVNEALKILRNPFAGNVNINELSSLLHVSRGKLFSAFREVTGASPLAALQKIRLENICALLKNKDLTLNQLAKQSAFPNEKYLIRFFRKYMGMTPGKYRKKLLSDQSEPPDKPL